jgi:hypothetical protein
LDQEFLDLNGQIINYDTVDGLRLKGYLASSPINLATIVHIHGSCGNFYENPFLQFMAKIYIENGINFLSVNNRGHDCIAEAYRHGQLVYIGGANEILDECVYDLEGAIKFAEQLGSRVIIQGHSYGCLKVLTYLANTGTPVDFILLSPADTYQLQTNYIYPETVEAQVQRLRVDYAERMNQLVASSEFGEFGVRQGGVQYYIPITARSLISLMSNPLLGLLRYKAPLDYSLNSKAFVYFGGADALWTEDRKTVEVFFQQRVRDLYFYYCEGGDHHFRGFEELVVSEIAKWVRRQDSL